MPDRTATETPTAAADQLGQHMSRISEAVYATGWITGNEWSLWRALLDWRVMGPAEFLPDVTARMARLDVLQRAAGGWVWWISDGMTFVPEPRWLRLVDARAELMQPWRTENEELDRDVL